MKTKLNWVFENYDIGQMTEEQMKDLSVELWNDMAENDYQEKEESSLIFCCPDRVLFDCFACEYYNIQCHLCPFSKFSRKDDVPLCNTIKSPYNKWVKDRSKESCIEIAELFMN